MKRVKTYLEEIEEYIDYDRLLELEEEGLLKDLDELDWATDGYESDWSCEVTIGDRLPINR